MYNKFGFKKSPPVSKPGSENFSRRREIQPSITKLTRESLRYLPRESLAWLTQLPRESATFAELQKMMTDSDKNLMDDDDTDSFEALESRLKTPYKKRPSPLVEEKKEENNENHDESGIEPINETVREAVAGEEEEDVVEVQKVVEEQMVQELVQEEEQEEQKEEQEEQKEQKEQEEQKEQKEQKEQEEQEEQKEEVEAAPATPVSEATCVPLSVPRTPLVKSASNSDISRTPLVEVPLGERRSRALS